MRWIQLCFVAFLVTVLCACANTSNYDWGSSPETSPDDTSVFDPEAKTCSGDCITTAPATYTGPSLFWMGLPDAAPACPIETPHQGLEGYVDERVPLFARECLITPSDQCDEQGKTCAPLPRPEYSVCIHHDGDSPCPSRYAAKSTLHEVNSKMQVTLCCKEVPISG